MSPLPRALLLGAHRKGAIKMAGLLAPQMTIVGVSDALRPIDPAVLGFLLRSFHPPIQLLSLGGAYKDDDASVAESVWREYRTEVESHAEDYGEESGAKVGFLRTTNAGITAVKTELGVEGYESVGRAILRNLEKL